MADIKKSLIYTEETCNQTLKEAKAAKENAQKLEHRATDLEESLKKERNKDGIQYEKEKHNINRNP